MCINLLPLESFINASFQRIYVVRRNANAFNEVFDRLIKFFLISSKIVTTMVAVIGREVFAVSAARGTTIKWLSAFRTHDDPSQAIEESLNGGLADDSLKAWTQQHCAK